MSAPFRSFVLSSACRLGDFTETLVINFFLFHRTSLELNHNNHDVSPAPIVLTYPDLASFSPSLSSSRSHKLVVALR